MMDHMAYLRTVAEADVAHLEEKERTYQGSWKKRGGVGAFIMLARKWDRLEEMLAHPMGHTEKNTANMEMTTYGSTYDVFQEIHLNPSGEDGTVLAEIRDLRRYLLLVEAEMMARGVVSTGKVVPVHAVGDEDPKPVPVEDSNRHASRFRRGLNSFEWEQLPPEDKLRYAWDKGRGEYTLK